jgi:hypothetical protein
VENRESILRDAVEDCLDTYAMCKETVAYCLEAGGPFADGHLIVTLMTCADTCKNTAEFIVVETDLAGMSCGFCAIVCERCAERCEAMPDDEQMDLCAERVRKTAGACLAVAAAGLEDTETFLAP